MESLDMIPVNWVAILKELLTSKQGKDKDHDDDDDEDANDSDDEEEKKDMQESPSVADARDIEVLKPGNYFWTVITKASHDILYYQPAQFVNKYIDKKLKPEVVQLELRKLQYITLLSISLIRRLKRIHLYHEKMSENSSVSLHGIWMFNSANTFYCKYIKNNRKYTYIESQKEGSNPFDLPDIKKVFEFHESNFLSCIDAESIQTIIQTDGKSLFISNEIIRYIGTLYGETIDLIEICWIAIPTLFKLISTRESGARDLALRALTMLQSLDIKDDRILLLKAKLHLFLASLYLYEKNEADLSINTVNSELEDVEAIQEHIQDDKIHIALSHYVAFTRANFYHRYKKPGYTHKRHHSQHSLEDTILTHSKSEYDQVLKLLRECEVFLKDLDHSYDIERCKIALLTAHVLWKYGQVNDPAIAEKVRDTIGVFNVYKLQRLEVKATYIYAQIRLL